MQIDDLQEERDHFCRLYRREQSRATRLAHELRKHNPSAVNYIHAHNPDGSLNAWGRTYGDQL